MALEFLMIFYKCFFKISYLEEFLEYTGFISDRLPILNWGLELIPEAHFQHIF